MEIFSGFPQSRQIPEQVLSSTDTKLIPRKISLKYKISAYFFQTIINFQNFYKSRRRKSLYKVNKILFSLNCVIIFFSCDGELEPTLPISVQCPMSFSVIKFKDEFYSQEN